MLVLEPIFSTIAFGGFNPLAAVTGCLILFQISQIFFYGLPQNEPTEGWGLDTDSEAFSYRWKQYFGVQVIAIIVGASVILAGPELIFFPFKFV
tara:strand:- start:1208 stop:1489 length:282 start_codon:yes stop_codon:yes gene_type:complete